MNKLSGEELQCVLQVLADYRNKPFYNAATRAAVDHAESILRECTRGDTSTDGAPSPVGPDRTAEKAERDGRMDVIIPLIYAVLGEHDGPMAHRIADEPKAGVLELLARYNLRLLAEQKRAAQHMDEGLAILGALVESLPKCDICRNPATRSPERGRERRCDVHPTVSRSPGEQFTAPDYPRAKPLRDYVSWWARGQRATVVQSDKGTRGGGWTAANHAAHRENLRAKISDADLPELRAAVLEVFSILLDLERRMT